MDPIVRVNRRTVGQQIQAVFTSATVVSTVFEQINDFDLASQETLTQIIRRRTVERHPIVFRRQSRLAKCVKYCLRVFNGGGHL